MPKFIRPIKKKYLIYGGILILLIIAFFVFSGGNKDANRATLKTGDLAETIAITGKVKPLSSANLGFNSSGRVSAVNFKTGDKVEAGQVIASLESRDLFADLQSAEASYEEERIKLLEIRSSSPLSLNESKEKTVQAVKQAFSLSDNAVRNEVDNFFKNPRTSPYFEVKVENGNFIHYFPVSADLVSDLNSQRKNVENILIAWQSDISKLTPDTARQYADKSLANIDIINSLLDKVAFAVNSFTSAEYDYNATVAGYKSDVDSARTNVSTARASIITALQNLTTSPLSVGGVLTSVSIQESKVKQAESKVNSSKASLEKSIIRAPFSGVVVSEDIEVGEVANSGESVISLISENNMYIEADVSEIKIGKISVGESAEVSFDAYPGQKLQGKVVFIDPGETLVDGVPNYKIKIEIIDPEVQVKTGLTATVDIKVREEVGASILPLLAIKKEGDKYFVNKLVADKPVKTEVQVGIIDNRGSIQILSGLNLGEEVSY